PIFRSIVEGHAPVNVVFSVEETAHRGPGKRLVALPVKEPAPSFNLLSLVTVTEPVRLPPLTSPSCAITQVAVPPPRPSGSVLVHVPATVRRIVRKGSGKAQLHV